MAWYNINYTCGHTDRMQLYGKETSRQREIHNRERGNCQDCWKNENAKRNSAIADAAEAANPDLPALVGSDAQVLWARGIRARAVDNIARAIGQMDAIDISTADAATLAAQILRQVQAEYWIDRRDSFGTAERARVYIAMRLQEKREKAAGKEILNRERGSK
jgi:hypothetical protein